MSSPPSLAVANDRGPEKASLVVVLALAVLKVGLAGLRDRPFVHVGDGRARHAPVHIDQRVPTGIAADHVQTRLGYDLTEGVQAALHRGQREGRQWFRTRFETYFRDTST